MNQHNILIKSIPLFHSRFFRLYIIGVGMVERPSAARKVGRALGDGLSLPRKQLDFSC
jgi:hypothetical protein